MRWALKIELKRLIETWMPSIDSVTETYTLSCTVPSSVLGQKNTVARQNRSVFLPFGAGILC